MNDDAIQCMANELAGVMALMLGPYSIYSVSDTTYVYCDECEKVACVGTGRRRLMDVIEDLKPHIHQHATKLMSDLGMSPN